jgi:hypothetical protein
MVARGLLSTRRDYRLVATTAGRGGAVAGARREIVKNAVPGVVFSSWHLPRACQADCTSIRDPGWVAFRADQESVVLMRSGGPRLPALTDTGGRTPVGINIGIGAVLVVAAAIVAALIPVAHTGWRFAVVAVVVGLFAVLTVDHLALAPVALLGWLVVNGFLVDRFGELTWHGSPDLYRLMLLVMAGALGLAVGEARQQILQLATRWQAEAQWRAMAAHIDEEERRDA